MPLPYLLLTDIDSIDIKVWVAVVAASASLIVGLINLWSTYNNTHAQILESHKAEKRDEIYKKLNDFYGPFQQYLNNSKELYKIFTSDKPESFRTLIYLLKPQQAI